MRVMIEFLYNWQELVGAFLGPFLAIILSVIGFFIKDRYEKEKEYEELLRMLEVSLTQALNNIGVAVTHLEDFSKRADEIISNIDAILAGSNNKTPHEKSYVLFTDFPLVTRIGFDQGLTKGRFKSYYLHNKILNIAFQIRYINDTFFELREEYKELMERYQFSMKIKELQSYKESLKSVVFAVNHFRLRIEKDIVSSLLKTKLYNEQLRKKPKLRSKKYKINKSVRSYDIVEIEKVFSKKGRGMDLDDVYKIDSLLESGAKKCKEEAITNAKNRKKKYEKL